MIGRTALAVVIYHADKLHQWVEMRREVAHQTNLFELSLGGHSTLNELLSRSQLSVCITCSLKGMQALMWNDLHAWLCKDSRNESRWSKNRVPTFFWWNGGTGSGTLVHLYSLFRLIETFDGAKGCRRRQPDIWLPALTLNSLKSPVFWDVSPDFILSSFTASDRYVIAALSGTYLPFRFQPGSLTFSLTHHSGVWGITKLEISGGDITAVLIKLRCHSL